MSIHLTLTTDQAQALSAILGNINRETAFTLARQLKTQDPDVRLNDTATHLQSTAAIISTTLEFELEQNA